MLIMGMKWVVSIQAMEKLSLLALKALSPLYDMHFSTAPEKQCPTMMEVVSMIPMGIRLLEGNEMLIVFPRNARNGTK